MGAIAGTEEADLGEGVSGEEHEPVNLHTDFQLLDTSLGHLWRPLFLPKGLLTHMPPAVSGQFKGGPSGQGTKQQACLRSFVGLGYLVAQQPLSSQMLFLGHIEKSRHSG